jgi:hypothetical protein
MCVRRPGSPEVIVTVADLGAARLRDALTTMRRLVAVLESGPAGDLVTGK